MNNARKLIAILGTTGAGKSQLSIAIAKRINGEIINADSMQMYQGLDTITNKHPIEEREGVPHHLLGHVGWDDEYSVLQFERDTDVLIRDICGRGKVPILVGGTHYYIQSALLRNATIASSNEIDKVQLTKEQCEVLESSPNVIFNQLKAVDPIVAQKFHPNDHRRIRQALKVYYTTGQRASDLYEQQQSATSDTALKFKSLIFWVYCDKSVLDPRLDQRVDDMVTKGNLIPEVRTLYEYYRNQMKCNGGTPPDLERGVYQVIGFKEFLPWLEQGNNVDTKGDEWNHCVDNMKTGTRRYAGKQTKWINKKLIPTMSKYGATVALLDASDLNKWDENVAQRGTQIAQEFLAQKDNSEPTFSVPLVPPDRSGVMEPMSQGFTSDQWKHFNCEICDTVSIGEHAWSLHKASRKHKRLRDSEKRKQERDYWIAYKKQQNEG